MKLFRVVIMGLVALSLLAGCSPQPAADTTPIKFAALPILDVLPVYVAQEAGFFTQQGIQVEIVPVASAAERDQVVAAGQADGMVNDLLSVALYNRKQVQVQVIRYARLTAAGAPLYRILASPKSGITKVQDLAGVEIAVSQGSIIDFVTDSILTHEGVKEDQVKTVAVPKIPDRMSLLASGQVRAATLPEPFATLAIQQGAVVVVDDVAYPDIANSVISFRKPVMDERPGTVKKFLAAINQAVDELNVNPEKWRKLLDTYKLVPSAMVASYPMPKFPGNSLPGQVQFDLAVNWALGRGLIDQKLDFASSIKAP